DNKYYFKGIHGSAENFVNLMEIHYLTKGVFLPFYIDNIGFKLLKKIITTKFGSILEYLSQHIMNLEMQGETREGLPWEAGRVLGSVNWNSFIYGFTGLNMEQIVDFSELAISIFLQSCHAIYAVKLLHSCYLILERDHINSVLVFADAFPSLAMTTNSVNATALDTAATQGHMQALLGLQEIMAR
ncbi:hypothetical protein ACJX0J_013929, partial [Zea mays]